MKARPRYWVEFALLYALFVAARPLPLRWLQALGRGLGSVVGPVFRIRWGVVQDNLRQAFRDQSDAERRALATRVYRSLGMTLMEFLGTPRLTPDTLPEIVDLEGAEHLEAMRQGGRGGVLVSGHYGNFEYLGARLAALGTPVSFVAKTQRNPFVHDLHHRMRSRLGLDIIDSTATKEMIRAIRSGRLVGMLADQNAGPDGMLCPFLGRPAWVFRGPAYLAWKLDAPLLTGFIHRREDGTHVVRLDPPVYPDRSLSEEEGIRRLTEFHVRRLEEVVREEPESYYWVHRRWKVPEGLLPES